MSTTALFVFHLHCADVLVCIHLQLTCEMCEMKLKSATTDCVCHCGKSYSRIQLNTDNVCRLLYTIPKTELSFVCFCLCIHFIIKVSNIYCVQRMVLLLGCSFCASMKSEGTKCIACANVQIEHDPLHIRTFS